MTRLELILVCLICFALALTGSAWWGYSKGFESGKSQIQAEWDKSIAEASKLEKDRRIDGYKTAEKFESELANLKGQYNAAIKQRDAALAKKIVCPKSGKIGDVIIPVDTVRSMFNLSPSDNTTGTTPTKPTLQMRDGATDSDN